MDLKSMYRIYDYETVSDLKMGHPEPTPLCYCPHKNDANFIQEMMEKIDTLIVEPNQTVLEALHK